MADQKWSETAEQFVPEAGSVVPGKPVLAWGGPVLGQSGASAGCGKQRGGRG